MAAENFEALVTAEQVENLNATMRRHGPSWRTAYVLLTKDRSELLQTVRKFFADDDGRKALEEMIDAIPCCIQLFEAMVGDMKTSWNRLAECVIEIEENSSNGGCHEKQ